MQKGNAKGSTLQARLPSLDLLKGFEAAARLLSFTKAGDELFLSQSAVSRPAGSGRLRHLAEGRIEEGTALDRTDMSKDLFLRLLTLVFALGLATRVAAQDIPSDAPHCGLRSPPDAAAKGLRPPHRLPMRMFPVNPGDKYTGCQWFWIAYARPDVWDFSSVTYYEDGTPRIQRVTYPPLPVQVTIQNCVFGADGKATKVVEGPDWRLDCHGARHLKELLLVTPKENGSWEFF